MPGKLTAADQKQELQSKKQQFQSMLGSLQNAMANMGNRTGRSGPTEAEIQERIRVAVEVAVERYKDISIAIKEKLTKALSDFANEKIARESAELELATLRNSQGITTVVPTEDKSEEVARLQAIIENILNENNSLKDSAQSQTLANEQLKNDFNNLNNQLQISTARVAGVEAQNQALLETLKSQAAPTEPRSEIIVEPNTGLDETNRLKLELALANSSLIKVNTENEILRKSQQQQTAPDQVDELRNEVTILREQLANSIAAANLSSNQSELSAHEINNQGTNSLGIVTLATTAALTASSSTSSLVASSSTTPATKPNFFLNKPSVPLTERTKDLSLQTQLDEVKRQLQQANEENRLKDELINDQKGFINQQTASLRSIFDQLGIDTTDILLPEAAVQFDSGADDFMRELGLTDSDIKATGNSNVAGNDEFDRLVNPIKSPEDKRQSTLLDHGLLYGIDSPETNYTATSTSSKAQTTAAATSSSKDNFMEENPFANITSRTTRSAKSNQLAEKRKSGEMSTDDVSTTTSSVKNFASKFAKKDVNQSVSSSSQSASSSSSSSASTAAPETSEKPLSKLQQMRLKKSDDNNKGQTRFGSK